MTAAHCIKSIPPTWRLLAVHLGEYDTSTEVDCNDYVCADPPIRVKILRTFVHEDYKPSDKSQPNDIALLRLASSVPTTNYVKPICLPMRAEHKKHRLTVAGWGRTETSSKSNVLLGVNLSEMDVNQCNRVYSGNGVKITSSQVCAGGEVGKDSCRGDSGGPLMSMEDVGYGDQRWTAVGVVSFGLDSCGQPGWPGVYTRVSDYVPWIVAKLES